MTIELEQDELALIHWALISHRKRIIESDRLTGSEARDRVEKVDALRVKVRDAHDSINPSKKIVTQT